MRFARRIRPEVDINLTPLIDVVFLLLIFFMVSTTLTRETQLSIDLPKASVQTSKPDDSQIEVSITQNGDYAVNGVLLVNRRRETLSEAIQQASAGKTSLPLIITGDSAAPHQSVVTALDIAGNLGFTRVRITTRLADAEG